MRRRRSRRRPLVQAAAMSLAAVVTAVAVVRAGRRRPAKDTAGGLPVRGEGDVAGAGMLAPPVSGAAAGQSDAAASLGVARSAG
ncbi:hypothetical protein GA0070613_5314 [Micromonospora inositola]|uniref:Uncharacterized protein n=1 Tax=Micromonospora inositola TaxID=47865 RepID=A0A1C5JT88_9ACTN|nr:hypothetical protein GA0070613_5314 [Micromonospora inositola]